MRIDTVFYPRTTDTIYAAIEASQARFERVNECLRSYPESERTGRVLERPADPKSTGDARMTMNAEEREMAALRVEMPELAPYTYDQVLAIVRYRKILRSHNLTDDAKTVLLSHQRAALNELIDNGDYDAILYVAAQMKRVHDGD
jgi:hypothetical protein